jgi:SMODS-associating 2TM, beta-strand rich effector domain
MKNIRREIAIYIQFGTFIIAWVAVLYLSRIEFRINWEALTKIPEAIAVYSVLHVVFTSWAWRIPVFQGWLVPYPDLQGTWKGTLESTWEKSQTGERKSPIPVVLVIKQSFSAISCTLFTEESASYSTAAQISADEETHILRLIYNYTNRPKAGVRERSEIHDGAATLRIITKPHRALEGDYWTDRKTTGDLRLTFKSKDCADGFPSQKA